MNFLFGIMWLSHHFLLCIACCLHAFLLQQGGLGGLKYPLLSDFNKKAAFDYDVLVEDVGVALR